MGWAILSLGAIVGVARELASPEGYRIDYAQALAHPEQEERHLRAALEKNPRFSEAAIALAAVLEQRGDLPGARRELQALTERDRRFRPRWAQLNLEARQGRQEEFWALARTLVPMSFGDHRPLIELMWQMRPEAGFVAAQFSEGRAPLLMDLTALLMEKDELDTARAVFRRLAAQPYESAARANAGPVATAEERRQRGLDLCDLHLDRRKGEGAFEVWGTLVAAGLVDERLGASGANVNAQFAVEPAARGFDWRPRVAEGIEQRWGAEGWRIEFSGQQRDEAELLTKWSWNPGRRVWRAEIAAGDGTLLEWRNEEAARDLVRTRLVYRRRPGTMPARGSVVIRGAGWGRGER